MTPKLRMEQPQSKTGKSKWIKVNRRDDLSEGGDDVDNTRVKGRRHKEPKQKGHKEKQSKPKEPKQESRNRFRIIGEASSSSSPTSLTPTSPTPMSPTLTPRGVQQRSRQSSLALSSRDTWSTVSLNGGAVLMRRGTMLGLGSGTSPKPASMSPDVLRVLVEEARRDSDVALERRVSDWHEGNAVLKGRRGYGFGGAEDVMVIGYAPVIPAVPHLQGGGRIGSSASSGTVTPNPSDMYRTGSLASLKQGRSLASTASGNNASFSLEPVASVQSGNLASFHSRDTDRTFPPSARLHDVAGTSRAFFHSSNSISYADKNDTQFDPLRFDSEDN